MADPANDEGVSVNVILRCRPPNAQEVAERAPQVIQCNDALREVTLYQNVAGKQMSRTFRYDKVFGPDSKQERVYKQAIVPLVQEVLDGFNCTIFAYGQTGTGKTYTMEGGPRNSVDGSNLSAEAGVIPRAIKQIFDAIECNQVTDSSIKVSFMELYNEELTDLLSPGDDKDKKLRLLEDRSGVVVQGLEEMVVKNAAEIYQVLDRGTSKRRTAETLLNKRSSRSHSVFTITIHMKETTAEGEDVIKIGKLNLVDLAGSENISRSGAKDGRAREAGNINQSLLTLGRVITALVDHSGHVPYRDSKLTRLLRDSLGGKTHTCIIATIGPSVRCVEETISTLDYAHRAKNIRNRPELNQRISKTTMIKELTTEIERLKLDLVATREKNGIYISTERYDASKLELAQLHQQVLQHTEEKKALADEHKKDMDSMAAAHEREMRLAQKHTLELEKKLQIVNSQLAQAQVTIQEGRFVIMSHQRAEQAIAAHAMQLGKSLGDAASELTDVFERLSCSLQLTEGDRATLQGICELAGSQLGKLQMSLASAAQAQGQTLQDLQSKVDQYKQRKQQDHSGLSGQLAQLQEDIAGTSKWLSAAVAQQASTSSAALAEARASQTELAQELQQTMQLAAKEAATALNGLVCSLQAQGRQLSDFAQQQQTAGQSVQQLAAAGFQRAKDGLQEIGRTAKGLGTLSRDASAAASDHLSRFAADFEASMVAKQQQLLAQVGSLLAGFVQDRNTAVTGMVADLQQQLGEGQQQLATAAAQVTATADGCVDRLKMDSDAHDKAMQATQKSLSEFTLQAASELAVSCGSTQSLEKQMEEHTQSMNSKLCQHVEALTSRVEDSLASVAAQSQEAKEQLQSFVETLQTRQQTIAAAVDASFTQDVTLMSQMSDVTAACSQETSDAATKHSAVLVDVTSAISGRSKAQLDKQPPQLPEHKQLEVPHAALVGQLCCPPELVLVEHFREQRMQILERGGDPVEVFGLLAPVPDTDKDSSSEPVNTDEQMTENEAPDSPASSVRSALSLTGDKVVNVAVPGKRSKIPTLSRAGFTDRTNVH